MISNPAANILPAQKLECPSPTVGTGHYHYIHMGRKPGADGQKFRNCLSDISFVFQLRGGSYFKSVLFIITEFASLPMKYFLLLKYFLTNIIFSLG